MPSDEASANWRASCSSVSSASTFWAFDNEESTTTSCGSPKWVGGFRAFASLFVCSLMAGCFCCYGAWRQNRHTKGPARAITNVNAQVVDTEAHLVATTVGDIRNRHRPRRPALEST